MMYIDNPWICRFLNCVDPVPSSAGKTRRPVDTTRTVNEGKISGSNEDTCIKHVEHGSKYDGRNCTIKPSWGIFHKPR